MNTYVDTSTLLKRLLAEEGSEAADAVWEASDVLLSTRTIVLEARAALAAARRARRLTAAQHEQVKADLADLLEEIAFVEVTDRLIADACELAEAEALRGYDAIHLAAALATGATVFTSADLELCDAARRRGLPVANPLAVSAADEVGDLP